MVCPKCDLGVVEKITFRGTHEKAYLCASCGTVWFLDEVIRFDTGHDILAFGDYDLDNPVKWPDEDINPDEEEIVEENNWYEKFL